MRSRASRPRTVPRVRLTSSKGWYTVAVDRAETDDSTAVAWGGGAGASWALRMEQAIGHGIRTGDNLPRHRRDRGHAPAVFGFRIVPPRRRRVQGSLRRTAPWTQPHLRGSPLQPKPPDASPLPRPLLPRPAVSDLQAPGPSSRGSRWDAWAWTNTLSCPFHGLPHLTEHLHQDPRDASKDVSGWERIPPCSRQGPDP